jgi:hypothetical protein
MEYVMQRRFLALKCGLVALFFVLSALLVACSNGPTTSNAILAAAPTPTLSIQMGNGDLSPTPTPLAYTCGAWTPQPSTPMGTDHIGVYAKFTTLVNGNPQGVDNATATASVHWPNGTTDTLTAQTTFDGLAVFTVQIGNHTDAINKIVLVTIHFEKAGEVCDVASSQAAFFTLVVSTPTVTATPKANGTPGANGTPRNQG